MMGKPARAIRRTLASIIASAVVWLPNPLAAQVRLADTEVGAYFGFRFTESSIDQERLGGLVLVPFLGPAEFVGSFGVFTNYPGVEGFSGSLGDFLDCRGATVWEAFGVVTRLWAGDRPFVGGVHGVW